MNTEIYTVFDLSSGLLRGHSKCAPDRINSQLQRGQGACLGELDLYAQRVDVEVWQQIDGLVTQRRQISGDEKAAEISDIDAHVDRLRAQLIVDYQPPAPDDDHDWSADTKRWIKRPEIQQRENARRQTLTRLDEIERKQHRRVRELLAASDPQMMALEEQAVSLRAELNAPASSDPTTGKSNPSAPTLQKTGD